MVDRHLLAEERRILAVESLCKLLEKPVHLGLRSSDATVVHIAPYCQLSSGVVKNGLLVLALHEPWDSDSSNDV